MDFFITGAQAAQRSTHYLCRELFTDYSICNLDHIIVLIFTLREQLQRYYPQMLQFNSDLAEEWILKLWEAAPTPAKAARRRCPRHPALGKKPRRHPKARLQSKAAERHSLPGGRRQALRREEQSQVSCSESPRLQPCPRSPHHRRPSPLRRLHHAQKRHAVRPQLREPKMRLINGGKSKAGLAVAPPWRVA